jgi:hypothetical protein
MNSKRIYYRIISDLTFILRIVFLISYSFFSGNANGYIVENADNVYIPFLQQVLETNTNLKNQTIFECCSYSINYDIQGISNKAKKTHPHSSFSSEKPRPKGISVKGTFVKHCISSEDFFYYPELTFKCYPPEYSVGLCCKASPAHKVRPPPALMN